MYKARVRVGCLPSPLLSTLLLSLCGAGCGGDYPSLVQDDGERADGLASSCQGVVRSWGVGDKANVAIGVPGVTVALLIYDQHWTNGRAELQLTGTNGRFSFPRGPVAKENAVLQVYWSPTVTEPIPATEEETPEHLIYQKLISPKTEPFDIWLGGGPAPTLTYLHILVPDSYRLDQVSISSAGGPPVYLSPLDADGIDTYFFAPTELSEGPITIQYFRYRDDFGQQNEAGETIGAYCAEPDATWEVLVEEGSNQVMFSRPASKCAQ